MNGLGIGVAGLGTILSAAGQIGAGNAALGQAQGQQQASIYRAGQLQTQAGQVLAVGQQQAGITDLNTKTFLSNMTAAAAGTGGTATSPTVVTDKAQAAARGAYNAGSEMFSAEEQATGLENQANLDIFTGQQELSAGKYKQQAAQLGAMSTILSGAGSLAAKYGGGFNGGTGYTSPADVGGSGFHAGGT